MHSVTAWLKSWSSDGVPPEKPEHMVVSESLLMELDFQIQEAEEAMRERTQQDRIKETGVDYSWLVTKAPKSYEIPELERLELEELCMKVKAVECGKVINNFRTALSREPKIQDISKIFKAVIIQLLDVRPKEDTMSEWMIKGLGKLRKPSIAKVMPVNYDENLQKVQHPANVDNVRQIPARKSSIEDMNTPVFTRVEDLPV